MLVASFRYVVDSIAKNNVAQGCRSNTWLDESARLLMTLVHENDHGLVWPLVFPTRMKPGVDWMPISLFWR
jgi:hypothetical protein